MGFVKSRGFECEPERALTDKEGERITALAATEGFSQEAAATLLEEEVRGWAQTALIGQRREGKLRRSECGFRWLED